MGLLHIAAGENVQAMYHHASLAYIIFLLWNSYTYFIRSMRARVISRQLSVELTEDKAGC